MGLYLYSSCLYCVVTSPLVGHRPKSTLPDPALETVLFPTSPVIPPARSNTTKEVSCRSQRWQSLLLIIRNAFRPLWMSSKISPKMVCTRSPLTPSDIVFWCCSDLSYKHVINTVLIAVMLKCVTQKPLLLLLLLLLLNYYSSNFGSTISHHSWVSCLNWLSVPEWSRDTLIKVCW